MEEFCVANLKLFVSIGILLTVLLPLVDCNDPADQDIHYMNGHTPTFAEAKGPRFLLYDVNPGEGFNLRRDVYMRIANLVKFLNDEPEEYWTLVLPPWGRLYHWKSKDINEQIKIRWRAFFDIYSLGELIPVMEYEDYVMLRGKPEIDEVYYLQSYAEGWTNGKWEEKMGFRDCIEKTYYHQDENGDWRGWFWGYDETKAKSFKCVSVQAHAGFMKDFLMHNTSGAVMLDRAESLLHGMYSEWSPEWWTARRSMRFAQHLITEANNLRSKELDSNDEKDKTELNDSWRETRKTVGEALGGPYVAVHLRRADFLYAHGKEVPSIQGAAEQLKKKLDDLSLKTLFVATDAPQSEFEELQAALKGYKVVRYEPSLERRKNFKDGGVAIVDQLICAHARYFVGSYVSTFSFRIHEERQILGLNEDTTYNRLCPDDNPTCEQPSRWVIKYD